MSDALKEPDLGSFVFEQLFPDLDPDEYVLDVGSLNYLVNEWLQLELKILRLELDFDVDPVPADAAIRFGDRIQRLKTEISKYPAEQKDD